MYVVYFHFVSCTAFYLDSFWLEFLNVVVIMGKAMETRILHNTNLKSTQNVSNTVQVNLSKS